MLSAKVTPSESKSVKGVSHMFEKNAITKTPLVEQQPAVRHISKGVLSKQTTSLNQRPASAVHHEPANAKNENGKRRLQAYVDQENIPPSGSIATTTTAAAVDGETQASWNVLGTKAGRIKKNEAAVDSWRKPLKLRPVAPKELIKSKVYKYEQGTLDEAPKTPSHDAPTRSKEYDLSSRSTSLKMCPDAPEKLIKLKAYKYKQSTLDEALKTPSCDAPTRSKKDYSSLQSASLKRDPLHYIHTEDAADKEVKAAAKPLTKRKAKVAPNAEIMVANVKLLHHNGVERSFEEVRAAALRSTKRLMPSPLREEEEEELKALPPSKKKRSNRYIPPGHIDTKSDYEKMQERLKQGLHHKKDPVEPICSTKDRVKPKCSKKDMEALKWTMEVSKYYGKLPVYRHKTGEAKPTPSNPSNVGEEKREEAASLPIRCNNADAAESAATQPAPLAPSLYEEEQANNKEITNCHPPPSKVQHDSADGHQSPLALLSPNGQQQKEEILESWTTSQQPRPDPSLNYLDVSGHLSGKFNEEIDEDISLYLNQLREQVSSGQTLELSQGDDFTIIFSSHNAICATPHRPHVTNANIPANQAPSNSYSTSKQQMIIKYQ
ncbi:hypothetical protein BDF22DRAFT_388309 [Syncephalis plumigaleata]|nr:hypothetical protein BDF22DRAFT_388309 [Syncephalis plumigaleata]